METTIALLRGINVSGRNKIPMAELRDLCDGIGWQNVRTYIQSGNVVCECPVDGDTAGLETDLSQAIAQHFGLSIPVIVRRADVWRGYIGSNPFVSEAETEPNRVMLGLSQRPPAPEAVTRLQERATSGEQVRQVADALWFYFPAGVANSKLTPMLLDRVAGSPVTLRNWRTVLKVAEMTRPAS